MTSSTEKKVADNTDRKKEAQALREIYDSKKSELGLKQTTLAELNGTSAATIFSYLNGKAPLNLEIAFFFAKHLKVDIADFSPRLAQQVENIFTVDIPIFSELPQLDLHLSNKLPATSLKDIPTKKVCAKGYNVCYYHNLDDIKSFDGKNTILSKRSLLLVKRFDQSTELKDKMIVFVVNIDKSDYSIGLKEFYSEIIKRGLEGRPLESLVKDNIIKLDGDNITFQLNKYSISELKVNQNGQLFISDSDGEREITKNDVSGVVVKAEYPDLVL